jgi:hypothetical protein
MRTLTPGCIEICERAAFCATVWLFAIALPAQTPSATAPVPAPQTAPSARHTHQKPAPAKPAPETIAATVPAPPPPPNWPANDKPIDASVVWDSRGLFIQASNSSLDQILRDVSLKLGVKVEGMGADERVFGVYGPGPARDVLSELLDGSSYNIMMVGDLGSGTPKRIVLSSRPSGPAPPTGQNNNREPDYEPENDQGTYEPPPTQLPPNENAPTVPMRTPQQMQQDRDRQIQLQQMQQQQIQMQNNPQSAPQNPPN